MSLSSLILSTTISATLANPRTASKKVEYNKIKSQVDRIDAELDVVVEQYNSSNDALTKTKAEIQKCADSLRVSEEKLAIMQQLLNKRCASVYRAGSVSYLSVLINTKSLDQFMYYLELLKRQSKNDKKIIIELNESQKEMNAKKAQLLDEEKKQKALLAQISNKKQKINEELKERKALLAKISTEIKQQELAEMKHQAELKKNLKVSLGKVSRRSVSRGSSRSSAVQIAMSELGKPYSWGATGPGSYDCSGLTRYVYRKLGISLPHSSRAQYGCGQHVDRDELRAGDLVFFARRGTISHVGIYVGGGNFIHAPRTGDVVKISDLSGHRGYVGATRP